MMLPIFLLWLMISTTSGEVCRNLTLQLSCSTPTGTATHHNPNDCIDYCDATWSCTNGEKEHSEKEKGCSTTWSNLKIPWKSYICKITMLYNGHEIIETCSAYAVDIQPVYNTTVGSPKEIHCSVNTADITNSDEVTVSWTGPNGTTITNDSRLAISPIVSNGTNHISTLQFSYLREDDEGLYECSTTVLGYDKNKTASIELVNFTNVTTVLVAPSAATLSTITPSVGTIRSSTVTSSLNTIWVAPSAITTSAAVTLSKVTPSVSMIGSSTGTPSSNTTIIVSSIAAVVTIIIVITIFGFLIYKRTSMSEKWSPPNTEIMTPPIDDGIDYSAIGREAPSTCENLENETVVHWINSIQMPTIDEDCSSICTGGTNDGILKLIYGKMTTDEKDKKYDNNEISAEYFPESVVFCSAVNGKANLGDSCYQDNTQAATESKHDVKHEGMNYEKATAELDKGCYNDYDTDKTISLSHTDETVTTSPDSTKELITKQPEDDIDMPHASKFRDSSIPPPDGDYRPVDEPSLCIPTVTSPSHHSEQ